MSLPINDVGIRVLITRGVFPFEQVDITDRVLSGSVDLGDVTAVGSSHAGVDATVAVLTLDLDAGEPSLMPGVPSTLNTPVDLLAPYREVRVEGWNDDRNMSVLFQGLLGDELSRTTTADGARITIRARDWAKPLQDMFISDWPILAETATPEDPIDITDVMQEILDLVPSQRRPTYSGGGIGFHVRAPYRPQNVSVWDALQQLAIQAGVILQVQGRALQIITPPRESEVGPAFVDWSLEPDDIYIDELGRSDRDVRNAVDVVWMDPVTRERQVTTAKDQWSIDNVTGGIEKKSVLELDSTSQISSEAEATALAERFISDMSREFISTQVRMPFTPSIKLFDQVQVNNPSAGYTRYLFVHSLRHEWAGARFRTIIAGVGRAVGSRRRWLALEPRPGSPNDTGGAHRSVLPAPIVTLTRGRPGFNVQVSPARGVDSRMVEIYWSTTGGFTPGPSTLRAVGSQERWTFNNNVDNTAVDYIPNSATLHYVRVRSIDSQGNPGAFSPQQSISAGTTT